MDARGGTAGWRSPEAQDRGVRGWAVTLALALHVPLYLLLRMEGEPMPVAPASGADQRIRLAWSERAPPPRPTALPPQPQPRPAAPMSARGAAREHVTAPVTVPAPGLVLTQESDAWPNPARNPTAAGAGDAFARDIFARGRGDAFEPASRMPGVRLHVSSILGRLHTEARRRACGSLRGALAGRPESTAAIMASMKRWDCGL